MTTEDKLKTAQRLVDHLARTPQDGVAQNDLLGLLYSSALDLRVMAPLLQPAEAEDVQLAGLFVLSELGARAESAVDLVRPLYLSQSPRVRTRVAEVLTATAVDTDADLAFLLSGLDAEQVYLVRTCCRALLGFSRERVLAAAQQLKRFRLLVNSSTPPKDPGEQLVVALGLVLSGDLDGALRVGDDRAGKYLVDAWKLAQRST